MRKKLLMLLVLSLFMGGCNSSRKSEEKKQAIYESYYTTLQEVDHFNEGSDYFNISTEMTKVDDNKYNYYIVIDEPLVGMFDLVVLAIESGSKYESNLKMMPSIGIFDDTNYNLVPHQANKEIGFVKGVSISGETSQDNIDLDLLVEWRNRTYSVTTREFIKLNISLNNQDEETTEGDAVE